MRARLRQRLVWSHRPSRSSRTPRAQWLQRRSLYVISTERGQDDASAYSRLLGTGGIEDPATGSAAGPAGCFLVKHGLVAPEAGAAGIVFLQGVQVRRTSR